MEFKGFRRIDIPLGLGLAAHSLFLKEHLDKRDESVNGQVLFAGNVDICGDGKDDTIDTFLRSLFGTFGEILSISISHFKEDEIEDKYIGNNINSLSTFSCRPTSEKSKFAHICFKKKSSLKSCLQAPINMYDDITRSMSSDESSPLYDLWKSFSLSVKSNKEILDHLRQESNIYIASSDISARKESIFNAIKGYELEEEIKKEEMLKLSNEVDDDGFRVVVNKKRNFSESSSQPNETTQQRSRKKRRDKELKNFYRHQIREEKREKLEDLRKKFDEDRERIAKMKQERKFKPF